MKKKIREIVREEIKATILFYLIPVDLVAFFSLNSEIKKYKDYSCYLNSIFFSGIDLLCSLESYRISRREGKREP